LSQFLFRDFQPLAAIATTPTAAQNLLPLCQITGATLWLPETLATVKGAQFYSSSLKIHLATLWPNYRGFIFGLATGAVVRLIAPLLSHKSKDPAVVVVDEAGKFVISLCSGHQGGADRLARLISLQRHMMPVITGAAEAAGLSGIDSLGRPFGWQRGTGDWHGVSGAIARRELVQVIQDAGSTLWQQHLPEGHPLQFKDSETSSPQARVWISACERQVAAEIPTVQWHPRVLWVGVGCERGTSRQLIELAIRQTFQTHQLAMGAIAGIATLDLKADEIGLLQLCQEAGWPLRSFSAALLRSIPVPHPSVIVAAEVGTGSVAEAAALKAAGVDESKLTAEPSPLRVTKQIIRAQSEPGAVTVAVAQAEQEFTDRIGQLFLVGTGPGQLDQMTPAAQTAVSQADAVIGYSLYIDLLCSLLRPGQIVESLAITQERQRAQRAIALAEWGLTVAVVSSGDAGIYGMAGLVLEELQAQGWDGKMPAVHVFPGVSALQAAASRVGTPLMHDFCAISLSDRLTPWKVIEQRLEAAAQADFVTALYNPRSQTRTEQIIMVQQIFLKYRKPQTPVAIVRSAYRADEQTWLTTLEQLEDVPIDMLTTVLIGNQSTRIYADWMITPRGYLGF
jgi:cobalt-precorrin 5A hydrolase/precorrin-3B C17-methyltransferase